VTPLVLDVKQAAAFIGVSTWVLRRYIDTGLLPTVQYPSAKFPGERSRRTLLAVSDLEAFVSRHRAEGSR
jgi:predicted site-specific integrase-resolvase